MDVPTFDVDSLHINFDRHEVTLDGKRVELSESEYRVLVTLVLHQGELLSATDVSGLYDDDPGWLNPSRMRHIAPRIREKLGWDGDDSPLEIVEGQGYRFRQRRS